jgi:hypothetical protein
MGMAAVVAQETARHLVATKGAKVGVTLPQPHTLPLPLTLILTLTLTLTQVGVVSVHLFMPWSAAHFLAALPESVRRIAVLDRTKEAGSLGEPLWQTVAASVFEAKLTDVEVSTL